MKESLEGMLFNLHSIYLRITLGLVDAARESNLKLGPGARNLINLAQVRSLAIDLVEMIRL